MVYRKLLGALAAAILIWAGTHVSAAAHDEIHGKRHVKGIPANPTAVMRAFMRTDRGKPNRAVAETNEFCLDGFAGTYPCDGVNLLAYRPLSEVGGDHQGSAANDIWGWTDPVTGREYALLGRVFGTSFIDITDPLNPLYLAELFAHDSVGSDWRDIKVYNDHAFIVSEAGGHGMQVFNLGFLRDLDPAQAPHRFDTPEDISLYPNDIAHYDGFGSAHNIVINEETGYAYAVGTGNCSGGLDIVNLSDPMAPVSVGCFSADGYTHDAQCVIYRGPDSAHQGKEICFASNEDTLTIVDVSNKGSTVQLARVGYDGERYTHQGWLSEDQTLFILDDELDEIYNFHGTRTRVFDVTDLDTPTLIDEFTNTTSAIDHNLYTKANRIYQANYRAGLRILDHDQLGVIGEVAYLDVYPANDQADFNGAWSNFPYFDSGAVVVSGIEQGLFVVLPAFENYVAFTSLTEGQTVSGSVDIAIRAQTAEGQGPYVVEWSTDGTSWSPLTDADGDGVFAGVWDSSGVTEGTQVSLMARLSDSGSEVKAAVPVTVTVEQNTGGSSPTVDIVSPDDGAIVSGNVTLEATASDDGTVVGVSFYDNGALIGNADLSGSLWTLRWNTKKLAAGSDHAVTAIATDNDSNSTESAPVTITIESGGSCPGNKPNCN